jgi:hypothetical protein
MAVKKIQKKQKKIACHGGVIKTARKTPRKNKSIPKKNQKKQKKNACGGVKTARKTPRKNKSMKTIFSIQAIRKVKPGKISKLQVSKSTLKIIQDMLHSTCNDL